MTSIKQSTLTNHRNFLILPLKAIQPKLEGIKKKTPKVWQPERKTASLKIEVLIRGELECLCSHHWVKKVEELARFWSVFLRFRGPSRKIS